MNRCPKCGDTYAEDAAWCPNDGTKLVPEGDASLTIPEEVALPGSAGWEHPDAKRPPTSPVMRPGSTLPPAAPRMSPQQLAAALAKAPAPVRPELRTPTEMNSVISAPIIDESTSIGEVPPAIVPQAAEPTGVFALGPAGGIALSRTNTANPREGLGPAGAKEEREIGPRRSDSNESTAVTPPDELPVSPDEPTGVVPQPVAAADEATRVGEAPERPSAPPPIRSSTAFEPTGEAPRLMTAEINAVLDAAFEPTGVVEQTPVPAPAPTPTPGPKKFSIIPKTLPFPSLAATEVVPAVRITKPMGGSENPPLAQQQNDWELRFDHETPPPPVPVIEELPSSSMELGPTLPPPPNPNDLSVPVPLVEIVVPQPTTVQNHAPPPPNRLRPPSDAPPLQTSPAIASKLRSPSLHTAVQAPKPPSAMIWFFVVLAIAIVAVLVVVLVA